MAKTSLSFGTNRRGLLTTVAAVTAAHIVPRAGQAGAPLLDPVQSPSLPPTPEVQVPSFCSATARRLLEIARRNRIREEALLPLLQVVRELRHLTEQERREEFERFAAVRRGEVLARLLELRREAEGNANWRPNWITGMGLQNNANKILREQFNAERERKIRRVA